MLLLRTSSATHTLADFAGLTRWRRCPSIVILSRRCGTQVQDGGGRVLVLAVGGDTEYGKTLALVGRAGDQTTPLTEKLNDLAGGWAHRRCEGGKAWLQGRTGVSICLAGCFTRLLASWMHQAQMAWQSGDMLGTVS